ncbi:glycosyl hydrolase family 76-domain-containing protein [Xylaria sp. CBS 124048]|nr:glycosyl hydrolase family 76-domain-containing protein [Xylaria sp. CBS 124048]
MTKITVGAAAAAAIAFAQAGSAIQLNTQDSNSIKAAAGVVAKGLYTFHNPAATTGQFNQPQPWYWWLSGSGWTGLMDYTVYTKDTTYKADLLSALSQNVGPKFDFSPPSQAGWEANDDLAYWLYNALTAMEYEFDTLPGAPTWDVIATNVFNLYVERWNADNQTCGGGLKWQYNPQANGWTYKNAVSNGAFFQTAARLARYTGEQQFADWATKIWDWSAAVGIVSGDFHVYDGASDDKGANCKELTKTEWTYNMATYIHGAAHMANLTGDSTWESRVQGLVGTASTVFFEPKTGIMFEQNCEPTSACTTDQTSFKASMARWLGKSAVLVPSLQATIQPMLEKSAAGAAQSCVGEGGSTCGISWTGNGWDGLSDFGVELSAMEMIQSLLVFDAPAPAVSASRKPVSNPKPQSSASSSSSPSSSSSLSAAPVSTFETKTKTAAAPTTVPGSTQAAIATSTSQEAVSISSAEVPTSAQAIPTTPVVQGNTEVPVTTAAPAISTGATEAAASSSSPSPVASTTMRRKCGRSRM